MKIHFKKIKKKGQIGETLTWIVATLIIIALLIFFIFGSSLLGKTKDVKTFRESLTSGKTFEGTDLFLKKSLFSYVMTSSKTDKTIMEKKFEKLESEGKFDISYNETRREIILNYNKRE